MPKRTVLLVDYDPKRIDATTRPFEDAGFEVEVARDGVAGVEAFRRVQPDVVFVEMMLPKRHGFDVCQELRRMRPDRKTPVYILGSTQAERYRLQALGAGANDYLARPIPDERLLELCQNVRAEPNQDLPAREPAASTPPSEGAAFEALEDLLATLDVEPEPPAALPAPAARMKSNVLPPLELSDLTDDEITARLDEILPSAPNPTKVVPSETRQKEDEAVAAEVDAPEAPATAFLQPDVAEWIEQIDSEPWEPENPPVAETEPEAIEVAAPAPKIEPIRAPKPRVAPVTAPRATLPQSAPARESGPPERQRPERSPSLRIAAAIGAVALAIVGLFAWRAWTGEDETAGAGSVVSQDFARVPPSPSQETSSFEPSDPDPQSAAIETGAVSTPAPAPVTPEAPTSRAAEPTREPRAETVRTPSPSPPGPSPRPAQASPPPAASPEPSAEARPVPSGPVEAEPRPAVASIPKTPPVEEPLGLPSSIAPVASASVVVEKPAPAPERTPRGALVELGEVDAAPVAVMRAAPAYPPIALRLRREGKVTVRLLVDETGRVADAQLADGPGDFGSEAVKAAREWTYRPATKDGVPVKVWVTEVVGFKL